MIDYDKYWKSFDKDTKSDFLGSLRRIQKSLEDGADCRHTITCLIIRATRGETFQAVANLRGYGEATLTDRCEICSIFPELRPEQKHIDQMEKHQNYCPCALFGREDAMDRLASVIERLEQ